MSSDRRFNSDRRSRDGGTPRSHLSDGYPKANDQRENSALPNRPASGNYNRYYNQFEARQHPQNRRFPRFQRRGQPWRRDEYSINRQPDNRKMRRGFRRRGFHATSRNRSSYRRNAFFRELPTDRGNFQQNQYFSTDTTRNYAIERRQTYFRRPQGRSRGMPGQSFKPYNNPSFRPWRGSSSQVLAVPKRLTEEELKEAASKWAKERMREEGGTLPERNPDIAAESTAPPPPPHVTPAQPQEAETQASTSLPEASQQKSRSEILLSKTKEIEHDYRQDCETFTTVVKKLIEKDPSLKHRVQYAVRQNLWEMGEHYVQVLKKFIAEYDESQGGRPVENM